MILLTGVTGKTGGATLAALLGKGLKLRAVVRNPEKGAPLREAGVDVVLGDLADPAVVGAALAGVEKALLIMPNSRRQLELEKQFADLARQAGVQHLVKMSSMEATASARSPIARAHYEAEQYIQTLGLAWTFVKPNFFMQNLLGSAGTIREQNKFFLPMGDGQTAMTDCRDIGAVTAAVLTGSGHANRRYEVTGPEILSFHDAADRFSRALGRRIEYVPMPMAAYRPILARFLTDEWHLNAVCALFAEIAAGPGLHLTDTVQKLAGRAPTSLEAFVREHGALFTP